MEEVAQTDLPLWGGDALVTMCILRAGSSRQAAPSTSKQCWCVGITGCGKGRVMTGTPHQAGRHTCG